MVIKGSFFTVSFLEIALFMASKSLFMASKFVVISFFLVVNSFRVPEETNSSIDVVFFSPQEIKTIVNTSNKYVFLIA